MRKRFVFIGVLLSILLTAQRSPAPIVEQPENPTPASEEQVTKSKSKHKRAEDSDANKPAETTKPKEPSKPRDRFGGTWSGKINQGLWGNIPFTLTLASGGSQVTERSSFGTYSHAATSNSQSTTWKSGMLNEITWTFAPNGDGNSARVTAKSGLGVNGDSIFQRGGAPAVVKAPSEFPTAKPVPERPGFVYNPFDPTSRIYIDVRGKPSGTKLVDPKSGKTFLVP